MYISLNIRYSDLKHHSRAG